MYTWEFVLNNKSHIIQFWDSILSGKKKIALDNSILFTDKHGNTSFSYKFSLEDHKFEILQIDEDSTNLKIDGISFEQLKEELKRKKVKNDFSNYEIQQIKKSIDSTMNISQNNEQGNNKNNMNNNILMNNNIFDDIFNNTNNNMNKKSNIINNEKDNMNNNYINNNNMMNNNYFTNNDFNNKKINELENRNKELENEIKLFRAYCNFSSNEKLILLNFVSIDQNINYSVVGKNTDDFLKYEKMLYEKYPKYKDTENYFLVNGKKLNRNRTLEENNIKNNDKIVLNTIDE